MKWKNTALCMPSWFISHGYGTLENVGNSTILTALYKTGSLLFFKSPIKITCLYTFLKFYHIFVCIMHVWSIHAITYVWRSENKRGTDSLLPLVWSLRQCLHLASQLTSHNVSFRKYLLISIYP